MNIHLTVVPPPKPTSTLQLMVRYDDGLDSETQPLHTRTEINRVNKIVLNIVNTSKNTAGVISIGKPSSRDVFISRPGWKKQ